MLQFPIRYKTKLKKGVGMSVFLRYNEHIKASGFYHILKLGNVPKGSDMLFDIRKKLQ